MVFTPGDRFSTTDKNGNAVVWRVNPNGVPYDVMNDSVQNAMVKGPRQEQPGKEPQGK